MADRDRIKRIGGGPAVHHGTRADHPGGRGQLLITCQRPGRFRVVAKWTSDENAVNCRHCLRAMGRI